jgi:two-component system, LuxR family, sensor kinase FixL
MACRAGVSIIAPACRRNAAMIPGWISIAWPMMMGIGVTAGALSLMAAVLMPRQRAALLAFAVFNLSLAVVVGFEFAMLRAATPVAYGLAMRWAHVPLAAMIIASIFFLRLHLGAGRPWLFHAAIGARLLTVAANFVADLNVSYVSITALNQQALIGGETVAVPVGVPNPWQALAILATLLQFLFVLDTALACWRREGEGNRRRAVLIGGSFLLFIAAALVNGQLIVFGVIASIHTVGVPYIATALAVMAELGARLLLAQQLAEKLAQSDADRRHHALHLAQVAQAAKLGTWELDNSAPGRIVASEQTRKLLGIAAAGPLEFEQFLAALRPGQGEASRSEVDRVLQTGGDFELERRVTLPDGQTRWVHTRGQSEIDARGKRAYLGGITFDVTELREAQENSRLVLEAAAFAIVGVDHGGRIVLVNRQAELLFGHARSQLLGGSLDMLVPPRFQARHQAHVGDMFKGLARAEGFDREVVGRCADGSERSLQIGLSAIQLQGQPVMLASIVDLTDRKRAERDLEQQRSELSHLSRVTMLGELSGSLAHELNQPLTAILSNAQAALRFMEAEHPDLDEVREILRDIVSDDKRAGEVIKGLRLLLKRGEMRQESIDINEVVGDVLRLLKSNTVNANVTVTIDLAEPLPPITGDRVQLQQVVLNLVMNACDAMADTPVAERMLSLRTRLVEAETVEVCVIDQGAGIAPDLLAHIFEPFVTTRAHGLGLGLSVCRQIVQAHQGRLWAANNPGRGATVCFALPSRPESSA